jgi:hypothetical protein
MALLSLNDLADRRERVHRGRPGRRNLGEARRGIGMTGRSMQSISGKPELVNNDCPSSGGILRAAIERSVP